MPLDVIKKRSKFHIYIHVIFIKQGLDNKNGLVDFLEILFRLYLSVSGIGMENSN